LRRGGRAVAREKQAVSVTPARQPFRSRAVREGRVRRREATWWGRRLRQSFRERVWRRGEEVRERRPGPRREWQASNRARRRVERDVSWRRPRSVRRWELRRSRWVREVRREPKGVGVGGVVVVVVVGNWGEVGGGRGKWEVDGDNDVDSDGDFDGDFDVVVVEKGEKGSRS